MGHSIPKISSSEESFIILTRNFSSNLNLLSKYFKLKKLKKKKYVHLGKVDPNIFLKFSNFPDLYGNRLNQGFDAVNTTLYRWLPRMKFLVACMTSPGAGSWELESPGIIDKVRCRCWLPVMTKESKVSRKRLSVS